MRLAFKHPLKLLNPPHVHSPHHSGILFSYDWWIVMYQFFLTVFTFLCIVDEDAHKFKHT